VASQLSWRLSSGYDRVNFDTAGLLEVAGTPTLLYVPQEAKVLLYEEVKLRMEGARAHPSTSVFLLNARTMSGDDLLTALLAAGIEVRPSPSSTCRFFLLLTTPLFRVLLLPLAIVCVSHSMS
jgi:hypothetical protein